MKREPNNFEPEPEDRGCTCNNAREMQRMRAQLTDHTAQLKEMRAMVDLLFDRAGPRHNSQASAVVPAPTPAAPESLEL